MAWEVVERHHGFKVRRVPATSSRPAMYVADFNTKLLRCTEYKPTIEEARRDGEAMMQWLRQAQQQEQALGRRKHTDKPHTAPSSTAPGVLVPRTLPERQQPGPPSKKQRAWKQAAAAAGCNPSKPGTQPRDPAPPAAAAEGGRAATPVARSTTNGPYSGRFVQLLDASGAPLQGYHMQLGRCIGRGGFASVYKSIIMPRGSNPNNSRTAPVVTAEAAEQTTHAAVPSEGSNLNSTTVVTAAAPPKAAAGTEAAAWNDVQQGGTLVAVKVYHDSKAGIKADVLQEYAGREVKALQLLRGHPHVVQLLAEGQLQCQLPAGAATAAAAPASSSATGEAPSGSGLSGSSSSQKCAVLELLPCTLGSRLQELGCCTENETKEVVRQLLQLLQVMQSGQLGSCVIVHRDLKPHNIMLRPDGTIAVADFGACSIRNISQPAVGVGQSLAADGAAGPAPPAAADAAYHTIIGTPYYAAPEMYYNTACDVGDSGPITALHSASYDCSVDVFAVGIVVLEMLVGRIGSMEADVPRSADQAKRWQQKVWAFVDKQEALPHGVQVSDAAREFVGCCCGVGRQREAAAARGEHARMTPSQLLNAAWLC